MFHLLCDVTEQRRFQTLGIFSLVDHKLQAFGEMKDFGESNFKIMAFSEFERFNRADKIQMKIELYSKDTEFQGDPYKLQFLKFKFKSQLSI